MHSGCWPSLHRGSFVCRKELVWRKAVLSPHDTPCNHDIAWSPFKSILSTATKITFLIHLFLSSACSWYHLQSLHHIVSSWPQLCSSSDISLRQSTSTLPFFLVCDKFHNNLILQNNFLNFFTVLPSNQFHRYWYKYLSCLLFTLNSVHLSFSKYFVSWYYRLCRFWFNISQEKHNSRAVTITYLDPISSLEQQRSKIHHNCAKLWATEVYENEEICLKRS